MHKNLRRMIFGGFALCTVLATTSCAPNASNSVELVDEVETAVLASNPAITRVAADEGVDGFERYIIVAIEVPAESFDKALLSDALIAISDTVPSQIPRIEFSAGDSNGDLLNLNPMLASLNIATVDMIEPSYASIHTEALRQFAEKN